MADQTKAERIERIQSRLKTKLPTGSELLRRLERHKLPGTVEEIELGRGVFCLCCGREVCEHDPAPKQQQLFT